MDRPNLHPSLGNTRDHPQPDLLNKIKEDILHNLDQMTPYHTHSDQPHLCSTETRATTLQLSTQVTSIDTTIPANKPLFPALPMTSHPTMTDHQAHLKTPQIMFKHHPKHPHNTTHPATHPLTQQSDTLHDEFKCNPTLSFQQSYFKTSTDKPQPTKNDGEWQGFCHHSTATNITFPTLMKGSNIPDSKPTPHDGETLNR